MVLPRARVHDLRDVQQTDGAQNEEKEPDAFYLWTRA